MRRFRAKTCNLALFASLLPLCILAGIFYFTQFLADGSGLLSVNFHMEEMQTAENAVVLRGNFDRDLPAGKTLWLYAENAEIAFSVHGTQTRYNNRENIPAFFRSPGSGWFAFSSAGIRQTETVEISVASYYGESSQATNQLLSRLYLGDGGGLYRLLLGQLHFFELIALISVVTGLIYLGEGAIDIAAGMRSDGVRIGIFGFYCFSGGLWCATDALYPFLSLLVTPPWVAALLDTAGLLLFPIALVAMMRYYMRTKTTRHILGCTLLTECATAAVCLLLQLIGWADIAQQQTAIGIIALISLFLTVLCIVAELRHHRDSYLILLLCTVLPVLVAIFLDGVNVLWPFISRRVLMRYSFGISMLLLLLQLASYARTELRKAQALRRMENELLETRISIMFSQIQPHFLYNTLQGIKQICDTDSARASEALEHFAFYLRGNLDSLSNPQLISFEKELVHIRDYLYLEKMRFAKKLHIEWALTFIDFMLPPLTVQPLIENAIRHGIHKKKGYGTLTIQSERTAEEVIILIRDDGVGFDPDQPCTDGRSHVGIENTRIRLHALCGGSLQIESEKGAGTTAKIVLPIKEVLE